MCIVIYMYVVLILSLYVCIHKATFFTKCDNLHYFLKKNYHLNFVLECIYFTFDY